MAYTTQQLQALIIAEARRQGVDPALALGIAQAESGFNPHAVGDNGRSVGLFQLQPAAAIDAGGEPRQRYEVPANIRLGIAYLKNRVAREGGQEDRGIAAYNQGVGLRQGQLSNPQYVSTVRTYQQRFQRQQPSLLTRVSRALSPASAEAAALPDRAPVGGLPDLPARPPAAAAGRARPALPDLPDHPPTPPTAPAADPRAGYEVEVIPGSTGTPPAAPAAAAAPTADTQVQLLQQQEQGRLAAERAVGSPTQPAPTLAELGRGAAAMGISTTGAMLGTAAGTLAAPFTGPFAPAMPLVGEMAGSYLARQANVALGLEDPSVLGDVLSVATPGVFGLPGVVRNLRAGVRPPTVPRGAEPLAQEAAERGVPLTYGEVTQQPMVQRAETLLEQVPVVGTAGFRRRQQAAVTQAAQAEATILQQGMQQVPWQGLPQVQQAAQQGNRQAQQVLDEIARSGDDWSRIVQASGNLRAFRTRQAANQLYGEVDRLAQPLGAVPPEQTVRVVDTVLGELRGAVLPDEGTIRTLEQMRERLTTTPRTYREMRQFDSDLGDLVREYYRGSNAVVGAKGVGSVTRVRTALRDDLDAFAQQSGVPEVREAHRRANRFYQQQVIPYEDAQLARALRSDTPDEIYAAFIQRGHRDRAQKFYHALEPRGRAAVQYGMVAEALESSRHPTTGHFSPARFASGLERVQDARGVFFRGEDRWRLDGLLRVMRAAERAGAFTENPPTGQRVIGAMLGAGAIMAPGTAAQVGGTSAVLSWLLTSRPGTSLLLRAHRAGEDTLALDTIVREVSTQGARLLATEGGERLQEGTQVQVQPGRVGR